MFVPDVDHSNSYQPEVPELFPSDELQQLLNVLQLLNLQQANMAFVATH